jgi:hypothetical protein
MAKIDDAKRMLLISNSTLHGSGYLDHAEGRFKILSRAGLTSYLFPTQFMTAGRTRRKPKTAFGKWASHSPQSTMFLICRELSTNRM